MSYTEIFGFDEKGVAYSAGRVGNAFRGAYSIWCEMGQKYLGSGPSYMNEAHMKKIWGLFNDKSVKREHRIVMGTTFDNVVVKLEDLPEVIKAFEVFCEDFPNATHLDKQAEVLKGLKDTDQGFAWNQTSVCQPAWFDWDEELDEKVVYNLSTGDKHWFLFDDFETEEETEA